METAASGPRNPVTRSGPHVVLIGPMGCGKTTVGVIAADRLGRPLLDNDVVLESATGMSARRIEEEYGTAELHRLERDALDGALSTPEPAVVTAAASVVDTVSAADLAPHLVVYLRCSPPVSGRRAEAGGHRPVTRSTAEAALRRDRRSVDLADVVIEVDDLEPDEVAARISVVDLGALSRRLP